MMTAKKINRLVICLVFTTLILSACAASNVQTNIAPANSTGMAELDKIIDIVQRGDVNELRSVIKLTETNCTFTEGLGGPPKCLDGEQEGSIVEVLPIIGPEGYFLRKDELENWDGLDISSLFAVYELQHRYLLIKTIPWENTQSFLLARTKTQA